MRKNCKTRGYARGKIEMTRKIKKLIKDFDISSFNYSGGMGGGDGGVSEDLLTTKGDTHGFSTENARVPIGANTQVLTADSTEALGLKWAAAGGGDVGVSEVISVYSTTLADYNSPTTAIGSSSVGSASNLELSGAAGLSGTNGAQAYIDLNAEIGGTLATTWTLRSAITFTAFTNTFSGQGVKINLGMSDTALLTGENPSVMAVMMGRAAHGASVNQNPYVRQYNPSGANAAGGSLVSSPYTATKYYQVIQTSVSNAEMKIFSDSTYAPAALEETITMTFSNNPSNLRYLVARLHYQAVTNTNNCAFAEIQLWDNTVTPSGAATYTFAADSTRWTFTDNGGSVVMNTGTTPIQAVDDNLATYWESAAATNNWIYVDNTTEKNTYGIVVYPKSITTETQYKIQWSNDLSTWTDLRLINVSALTNGVYNYIRFNGVTARYIRIYGNSGSSAVMSFNNIRLLEGQDQETTHGHLPISATDVTLSLDGT